MRIITNYCNPNNNYPNFGSSATTAFISNNILEIEKDPLSKIKFRTSPREFYDKVVQIYKTKNKFGENLEIYIIKNLIILIYIFQAMFPISKFNETSEQFIYTTAMMI